MQFVQEITLDIFQLATFKTVEVKEGDVNSRFLRVTLTADGSKITPEAGVTADFRYIKSNGLSGQYAVTIEENGTILIKLSEQVLVEPGVVTADVVLLQGTSEISCASFYVRVDKAPIFASTATQSNEFLMLIQATDKAENAAKSASSAANKATSAANKANTAAAAASEAASEAKQLVDYSSQGFSAKYELTTPGWKRILNIIRATSGQLNFSVAQSTKNKTVQSASFDISGFVKFPSDLSTDSGPVIIQKYNNIYGDSAVPEKDQLRITAIRVGYPKVGTTFPIPSAEGDFENPENPVNCYVDVYVEFDPTVSTSRSMKMNFSGPTINHNCELIAVETEATDTGIYGEQLEYVAYALRRDVDLDMSGRTAKFQDAVFEQLFRKESVTYQVNSGEPLKVLQNSQLSFLALDTSPISTDSSPEEPCYIQTLYENMVVEATALKTKTTNGVTFTRCSNGLYKATGTATNNALFVIYELEVDSHKADNPMPIILKAGTEYLVRDCQVVMCPLSVYREVEGGGALPGKIEYVWGVSRTDLEPITATILKNEDYVVLRIAHYVAKGLHTVYPENWDQNEETGDLGINGYWEYVITEEGYEEPVGWHGYNRCFYPQLCRAEVGLVAVEAYPADPDSVVTREIPYSSIALGLGAVSRLPGVDWKRVNLQGAREIQVYAKGYDITGLASLEYMTPYLKEGSVSEDHPWSSRYLVDNMCSEFSESARFASFNPVKGYPLNLERVPLDTIVTPSGTPSPSAPIPLVYPSEIKLHHTRANQFNIKVLERYDPTQWGEPTCWTVSNNGVYLLWDTYHDSVKLSLCAPNLVVGQTYTLSAVTSAMTHLELIAEDGSVTSWYYGTSIVITEALLNSRIRWVANLYSEEGDYHESGYACDIQIEPGEVATPFNPYVDAAYSFPNFGFGKGFLVNAPRPYISAQQKIVTLTGVEEIRLTEGTNHRVFEVRYPSSDENYYFISTSAVWCSHFQKGSYKLASGTEESDERFISSSYGVLRFRYDTATSIEEFREFLATQYAAGTPIQVLGVYAFTHSRNVYKEGLTLPSLQGLEGRNLVFTPHEGNSSVSGRTDIRYEMEQLKSAILAMGGNV